MGQVPPGAPGGPGVFLGYGPGHGYPTGFVPFTTTTRVVQTLTRRTWIWVIVVTIVLAGGTGAGIGLAVGGLSEHTIVEKYFPNRSVLVHPGDVQEILSAVEPAVVSIDTTQFNGGTGLGGGEVEGAGTGMILTASGEVLTNNHVVAGATAVTVTLFGQTAALPAHVIGTDPTHDLALVQIDGQSHLPVVTLGDSASAQVGDQVVAIGNALALQGGPTVTEGIISAQSRTMSELNDFTDKTETLSGLLQTDAPISPGNSGGPLVDAQGQVIGMNTAVAESSEGNAPAQNIGFAIAIDTVKPLLLSLLAGGTGGPEGTGAGSSAPVSHTADLGVVVENVTPAVATQQHLVPQHGAVVVGLTPSGPATTAGIQVGDVIVSLDGKDTKGVSTLVKDIGSHAAGTKVLVGLYRGSVQMQVVVTLGTTPG